MDTKAVFNNAKIVALLTIGISAAALAGAYFFQYVVGLQPCILCLYQRVPHGLIVILGVFALFLARKPSGQKQAAFVILLISLLYFIGTGLGFYHAGVEQHWWVSFLEACSNPMISSGTQDLLSQIENAKSVRCDSVPWQMFGISMAGYNGLLSGLMAVYTAAAAIFITRRANGL